MVHNKIQTQADAGLAQFAGQIFEVFIRAPQEDDTLMPTVVGKEFLMAKTELGNLHLDLDVQRAEAYSPDVPEGSLSGSWLEMP